ncbi:trimethylamine methyltransferase family protein [Desulfococcaceae bacterium HSG7]|nr:trimethylamine methyltransferase family protein [Desulfococcaceae bacterium HSG7]
MTNPTDGKAKIEPIEVEPDMRFEILSNQELEQLHNATLTVLHETGVKFPLQKALDIFADAGASVDFNTQIVKIPPGILMAALDKVPRTVRMGSRGEEALDLVLDGTRSYCGTAGTGVVTVDMDTGKERPSTKQDTAMMAKVSDYLPSICFYWPMAAPRDKPAELLPLHEMEASFSNTQKHVITASCISKKDALLAVRMAEVVAGNRERMKARPPLSVITSLISPLNNDTGTLEAALVFAQAGLPIGFAPMPVMGSTGPASIAGAMMLGNAEILSAICLVQLAFPGTPVTYPLFSGVMNPHTGNCTVTTQNQFMFYAGTTQLGHFYNLPVMSTFGGSDLCDPACWQTGKDDAVDAFYICATGPDMLPCVGMMETYTRLHPEKLLLDNNIIQSVQRMTRGIPVNSETLSVDEIIKVGPGGHFLDTEYTLQNMRKLWNPGIDHQWSPETGQFKNPSKAAKEKLKWILANHEPVPLDKAAAKEIKQIIQQAQT